MSPSSSRPLVSGVTPATKLEPAPRLWSIPQAGDVIAGKYRVEGMIGQGGLAVILRAIHIQLEEPVAIKLLSPLWEQSAEAQERFIDEGRAATKIRSEHVVRVHDVGTLDEGAPFMVMECLEGSDLEAFVRASGPLSVDDAIAYVLQAGEAIAEAHAHGIIHRDLKPANLFLTHRADGSACVKVLDFGISKRTDPSRRRDSERARMTAPDAIMGSPHYMAPEQLLSPHSVDARCDVWALGTILYELLAGKPPYDLGTLSELYHAVIATPAPMLSSERPGIPLELDGIIARCMQKSPDDRYASVAELATALAAISPASLPSAERIVRTLGAAVGSQPSYSEVTHPSSPPIVVELDLSELEAGVAAPPMRALDVLESGRRRAEGRSRFTALLAVAAGALLVGAFVGHEYVEGRSPMAFMHRFAPSGVTPSATADAPVAAAALVATSVTPPSATPSPEPPSPAVPSVDAPSKAEAVSAPPPARVATHHGHAARAPRMAPSVTPSSAPAVTPGSAPALPQAPLPAGLVKTVDTSASAPAPLPAPSNAKEPAASDDNPYAAPATEGPSLHE